MAAAMIVDGVRGESVVFDGRRSLFEGKSNGKTSGSMADCSPIVLCLCLALSFTGICGESNDYDYRNLIYLKDQEKIVHHRELLAPKVYHRNRLLKTTMQQQGGHYGDLTIVFYAFGRQFVLDLKLNTNLFAGLYVEKSVHESHQSYTHHSVNHTEQHCYYHGGLRTSSSSFSSMAAISTCDGIRGQFTVKNDVYFVEPTADDALPSLSSVHFIVRNSDILLRNKYCGLKADPRTKKTDLKLKSQITRTKKSVENRENRVQVLEPTDSNDATRYVELYVVNDFTQFAAFNRRADEVIRRTKDIINIVSSIYRPLGIYVILVGVEVWTERNFIEVNGNSENTLNQFLEYRRKHINPLHRNDNAQLIIGRELGNGIVGKAPIMTICTYKLSGGVNSDRRTTVGAIATTVAHEMGHNFGLSHDNSSKYQSCECEESQCVMSSEGSVLNPTKWSSCSKQVLSDTFHQGMDYCLQNIPETTNLGAVCGNGFMEDGEECDCGLERDCKDQCCIASTCRLAPNATCASGKCCNLATCQPLERATVCRKARGFCDLPEFCDGKSEHCPSDVFRENGAECEDQMVKSYCYRGSCKTHDSQCRLLWGRTGKMSNSLCFERFNVMGSGHGHCGFSWINESFRKCELKDVLCGMLHCEHRSEKLMFWKEALMFTMPDSRVLVDGFRYDCKAAIMDVGLDMPDPGMTFDGTKCGERQMCLSHRCVAIEALNAPLCPDCNGHGVCNSLGQCHCDLDYDPPYCQGPGTGGSVHSGPAQKYPPSNKGLALGLCLFFFVILPFCIALIVLIYRNYDRVKVFALRWCQRCQPNNFFESKVQKSSREMSSPKVAVDDNCDGAAVIVRSPSVRRAVSFRPEDISRPLLQSSTNSSLDIAPTDKTQVTLTHANSCRAPNTCDETQTFARTNPKITNLNDNSSSVAGNRSSTSRASDVRSSTGATDVQLLLLKQHDESTSCPLAPLRPAPPPPYACPKKNTTEKTSPATKLPLNSNNSSQTESGKQNLSAVNAQSHKLPSIASAERKMPGSEETSRRKAAEKKTFDKSTADCPTKEVSKPLTNSISQLRSTFEGNNFSSNASSDASTNQKNCSSFRPSRPKVPPSIDRVSNPPSAAESSKPAVPKRPPPSRPQTFSAGSKVKATASQLQHHTSEVTTNKKPSLAPRPRP